MSTSSADDSQHAQTSPLISEQDAIAQLIARAQTVTETENINTLGALDRILAVDLIAPADVPNCDNSAMDGYAINSADINPNGPTQFIVTQRIAAGAVGQPLIKGSAARIFTGAPIPSGANTVVMQEDCEEHDQQLTINTTIRPHQHVRYQGEDIPEGTVILRAGTRLNPQDLGLAASIGCSNLNVFRRLRVAVFFTGDELRAPGEILGHGTLYNSNRYTLTGLLQKLGCDIIDLGMVADNFKQTQQALQRAQIDSDLILTSGGVSVGEEDHVKAAVTSMGQLELWRIAIKPGKPLAFGRVGDTPFIGLPGNPVSLFATFCILARPFILKSQGRRDLQPVAVMAIADFDFHNKIPRRAYLRARITVTDNGTNQASLYAQQGSGVLSSVSWANCFVMIADNKKITKGDTVSVLPFATLLS